MSKPEIAFKASAVRAAMFRNIIEKAGKQIPLPKVILEVRYRDKAGQWKGTNSLSLNEIPKAILTLQKAYDYLTTHREGTTTDGEDQQDAKAASWGGTFQQ